MRFDAQQCPRHFSQSVSGSTTDEKHLRVGSIQRAELGGIKWKKE